MSRFFSFFGLLSVLTLLIVGCSSTRPHTVAENNKSDYITGEEARRAPTVRLSDLIRQRVPGITLVQTADGSLRVRMRGRTSFTTETFVLFVVDDQPMDPEPNGRLPGITVHEIESIRVYKDPVDTARWGMRGSNGVIVIETKKGR